jgi:hypothetical protein
MPFIIVLCQCILYFIFIYHPIIIEIDLNHFYITPVNLNMFFTMKFYLKLSCQIQSIIFLFPLLINRKNS